MNKTPKRIAITTGDRDGIGLEITAKALYQLRPQRGVQFVMWRSKKADKRQLRKIDKYFHRVTVTSWSEALRASTDYYKDIIDIESPLPPSYWVEHMAKSGLSGSIDGLVTAPLSKTEIYKSGFKDKGHTDILKRVCRTPDVFMTFLGRHFNVTLLTDHVALNKGYLALKKERIVKCAQLVHEFRKTLPTSRRSKEIGLVACNPHAGENGLLGLKENEHYMPALKQLHKKSIRLQGPLVPDVCFQKKYWKQFSFYIASYHDQGLIPFKMAHGDDRGVQLSLGLPFLRTSVDHGTAKDIFGLNRADSTSMYRALKTVLQKLNNKTLKW